MPKTHENTTNNARINMKIIVNVNGIAAKQRYDSKLSESDDMMRNKE